MTAPMISVDPVAEQDAREAALAQRIAAHIAAMAPAKIADLRTVQDLGARFVANEIGSNPQENAPARADWKRVLTHLPYIYDLEFQHEGRKITLGALPWTELTMSIGSAWLMQLGRTPCKGKVRKPRNLSPGYVIRILGTLQAIFKWHITERSIERNPARGWRRPKNPDGQRVGFFEMADFRKFCEAAHPLLARMMILGMLTGMRKTEVRLLAKNEVDWEKKTIELKGARKGVKNGKPKTIPLVNEAFRLLEEQLLVAPGEFLFPSPSSAVGAPVVEGTMENWMVVARKKAGLVLNNKELPVFHHLRHSFAMDAIEKEMPIGWIMDVCGWSSMKMVNHYTKLSGSKIDSMRERMEAQRVPRSVPVAAAAPTWACPVCETEHLSLRAAADCEDACRMLQSRAVSPIGHGHRRAARAANDPRGRDVRRRVVG